MSRGAAVLGFAIAAGAAVLQSTLLRFVAIAGVQPDLVVIIVIFVANRNGSMVGQLAGFGAGIVLDVIGLSPLGFYALAYAIIGAVFGLTRGKVFVDPIFMPFLFTILALVAKAVISTLVSLVYGLVGIVEAVFSVDYLIGIGYSTLIAPLLFALLRLVGPLKPDTRRGDRL